MAEIGSLYVLPFYHNRGIGKKMVDYACLQAKERGAKTAIALSTQSVGFFLGVCGFEESDEGFPARGPPQVLRGERPERAHPDQESGVTGWPERRLRKQSNPLPPMKAYSIDTETAKTHSALRRALLFGLGLAAAAPLVGLTTGCVVTARPVPVAYAAPAGEVYVDAAPPAPIVETAGIAPGPGFVWVGGYYHWYGAPLGLGTAAATCARRTSAPSGSDPATTSAAAAGSPRLGVGGYWRRLIPDLDDRLDLGGRPPGQSVHGDRGPRMAARVAENLQEQVARPVDHGRAVGKPVDRVDEAGDEDDPRHPVERAERGLDVGQGVQGAGLGGLGPRLHGLLAADLSGVGQLPSAMGRVPAQ